MSATDHLQSQQMWHGSPSGDLRGAPNGLHIGTRQAAEDALNARVGKPADDRPWDGSRELGGTPVHGSAYHILNTEDRSWTRHEELGPFLPKTGGRYADGSEIPLTAKPRIDALDIAGRMTNTTSTPHEDFKANGYMSAAKKRGTAKSGYYYTNVSEDEGSISAVVPDGSYVRRPRAIAKAATVMLGGRA